MDNKALDEIINEILEGSNTKATVEDFTSSDAVPTDSITGNPTMGVTRKKARRKKRRLKLKLRRRRKMKSKKESAEDVIDHAEELEEKIPSLKTKNKGEPKERKGYVWKKLPVQPQEGDDNMKTEAKNPDGIGDGKPKTQGDAKAPNVSSIPGSGGPSAKGAKATHKNVDGIGSSKTGAEEPAKDFTGGKIGDANNVPGCKISMPGGVVKTEPVAKSNVTAGGKTEKPAVSSFIGKVVTVKTIQQGKAKKESADQPPVAYKCPKCFRHMHKSHIGTEGSEFYCVWCDGASTNANIALKGGK